MRRALVALLALAPLLAGCLQPEEGRGLHVPVGANAPRQGWQPLPAACPAEPCSWHWLNVSVRSPGEHALRIVVPVPPPAGPRDPHDPRGWLSAWGMNVTVSGDGHADVSGTYHETWSHVRNFLATRGKGDLVVRAHALASGPDAREPWRWNGSEPALDALPVHQFRTVEEVVVTYEAAWDGCRREARFVGGSLTTDRWRHFPGEDRTTCG